MHRTPLLVLNMGSFKNEQDNIIVDTVPSIDKVEEAVVGVIKRMIEAIRSLSNIEPDMLSLLDLPSIPILDLVPDNNEQAQTRPGSKRSHSYVIEDATRLTYGEDATT